MRKLLQLSLICLFMAPAFAQPARTYQVAVIVGVKPHELAPAEDPAGPTRYEVSLRIDKTIYTVLYTPPLGISTVKYAEGHNILVVVGEKAISYNDLLGQTYEVPIISSKPADTSKT